MTAATMVMMKLATGKIVGKATIDVSLLIVLVTSGLNISINDPVSVGFTVVAAIIATVVVVMLRLQNHHDKKKINDALVNQARIIRELAEQSHTLIEQYKRPVELIPVAIVSQQENESSVFDGKE